LKDYDKLAEEFHGEIDYDAVATEAITLAAPPIIEPYIETPQPAVLFPNWSAGRSEARIRDFNAQAQLQIAQINHSSNVEGSVQAAQHALHTLPTKLKQQDELLKAIHETALAQNQAIAGIVNLALKEGMDVPTYGLVKVEREKHTLELEKTEKLSNIKIDETKRMDANRLDAYEREIGLDLQAATAKRLLPHLTVQSLEAQIQRAVYQRAKIKADFTLDDESREMALQTKDELIAAFRMNLNEQMARHLLQAGNGANLQAVDQATDSPSGN